MAFQSLYRRYRPRRFSDVRGQDYVVKALRNAVREDRVGHAYLFSGPRGTGKTSTARILAKALNCPTLTDGEPCGVCESCMAIDAGTSYDVQELDAASNNKVDDVRDLIARVALGSPGRTKVYILDEVHMLTAGASASLLKTLEEPPPHVVFVLATTDPQKVLDTIRSRTQHFQFHLLSAEELAEHVAWVIHDAGLDLPDDVIDHIVRQGGGSARDTLSALEQVAAAGGVAEGNETLDDLLDAIAAADAGRALAAVAEAVARGRDPRVLGEAVLARLRDVFLLRMGASVDHLPPGDVDRVRAWADQLGDRATTRALEAVGDALLEMRQAPDARIPLEVALVKLTRAGADPTLALAARVAALEAAVAAGGTGGTTGVTAGAAVPRTPAPSPSPSPAGPGAGPPPSPSAVPPSTPPTAGGLPAPDGEAGAGGSSRPRPADDARARLATYSTDRRSQTARSESVVGSRPAGAPPPSPGAPKPSPPPQVAQPGSAPPPAEAAASGSVADAATGAGAAEAPNGGLDQHEVEAAWSTSVLPRLTGLAKAMYAVGRIAEVDATTVTLAMPNEVHAHKCERKRGEVQQALTDALAVGVTVRLVVDEHGEGRPAAGPGGGTGPDEDLDLVDVHDLEDAPDAPAGGIEALTQAFPGSELVEEA